MPLTLPPILLAIAILVTAASGIWLLLNLRAVARLFKSTGVIEPGPGPRQASRKAALIMLVVFNLGWISCIAIWSYAMSGEANEAIATGEA